MGKIQKYYKSSINILSIQYGKEHITLNIAQEAKIKEDNIEDEIKRQPASYAFLFMLHKKLLTEFERLKLRRKSIYGILLAEAKRRTNSAGRPLSDNDAKAWVESHRKYIRISERCIEARDQADQVQAAVKSFEQKKDLIQSLSANLRNERV